MSARECDRCDGCGQIANDDEGTPWKYWAELTPPADLGIRLGIVRPLSCPECKGTGAVEVRP